MTNVADLHLGGEDALKQKITCFYGRKPPQYAVYRVSRRVMVHFADDEVEADKQRAELSQLAPLRGEIEGLIDGWRDGSNHRFFGSDNSAKLQSKATRYDRRVGDALVVALEDDLTGARMLLNNIKQNIVDERVAWGRFEYLIAAFITAVGAMFAAWLLGSLPALSGEELEKRLAQTGAILIVLALLAGGGLLLARSQGAKARMQASRAEAEEAPGGAPSGEQGGEEGGNAGSSAGGGATAPAPGTHASNPPPILTTALLVAFLVVPIFAIFVAPSFTFEDVPDRVGTQVDIWRAVAAGAVGAFFSIALAIRKRTVLPDLLRMSNVMDATLRVVIGVIAAAVLMVLVKSELVSFNFGGRSSGDEGPLFVLLFGFLAGFSERLVPDLLEKAEIQPRETPTMLGGERPSADRREGVQRADPGATPSSPPPPSPSPAEDADPIPQEANEDGCAEHIDLDDDEVTHDADLPPATGGVAAVEGEVR
jgi:hypothetical protein